LRKPFLNVLAWNSISTVLQIEHFDIIASPSSSKTNHLRRNILHKPSIAETKNKNDRMNIDNSFRYISNNSSCVSNESEHTKKIGAWMYSSTAQTAMSGSSYGFGFDDENLNEDSLCTNNYPSMNNVKSNSCTQGKFQSSFEINNKKSRNQKLVSPENRRILQVSNSTQKAAVSRPFPIPVYPNDKSSSKIINSQVRFTQITLFAARLKALPVVFRHFSNYFACRFCVP